MLEFKNIHIGYKGKKKDEDKHLFSCAEMTFEAGEFVAVIGPNGAGKTTLFNTILGAQALQQGEIRYKDTSFTEIPRKSKVEKISFVPSKFLGVDHLNLYDLIAMGRAPHTNLLNQLREDDHQVVQEIIARLKLEHLQDRNTLDLSDGERQIAMIGKALAQETEIIILDEPTAFLDYNNRRKTLQLLKELAKEKGQLIFMSSHDLELCFEYCSRVVAIDKEERVLISYDTPFDRTEIISSIFREQ